MKFRDLKEYITTNGDVDFLKDFKNEFLTYANKVLSHTIQPDDPELKEFIELCLDYYTYSTEGDVLIPDTMYDVIMNYYKSTGKSTIVYADGIKGKRWNFIKHEVPALVGTIGNKLYNYKELKSFLDCNQSIQSYIMAPKFDGISCAIKVVNGQIIYAATRYDGYQGQDITELIKRAGNSKNFFAPFHNTGFYKCELCVTTDSFNELIKIQKYANRRSATSAICNTPTNLKYAEYITIVPLLYYDKEKNNIEYIAPFQKKIAFYSPGDLMTAIEDYLENIRTRDFQFRVDGVVIYPDSSNYWRLNEDDFMDRAAAYKVNTMENKTTIEYGYMSIGRMGKAIPMLHVAPVEVNETIVTDVSLGSWEKFMSMNLLENDEVIVYSAGDVIPQVKLPSLRLNLKNADLLKIKRRCPYCNEKLERIGGEYYCINPDCPRVITGKITNFLVKLGMEKFSDKSVEMIYNALNVRTIHQFLHLSISDILSVDGFEEISANSLYNEIQKIRKTPVSISKFFGALGIDKISEKKCRMIFECIDIKELMNTKNPDKLYFKLQSADGIGPKTAQVFINFLKHNFKEIQILMQDVSISKDEKFNGNIVFTGLRPSDEIKNIMKKYGYEEGSSVTSNTICVVAASLRNESTKIKAATKKNIPVIYLSELENFLNDRDYKSNLRDYG